MYLTHFEFPDIEEEYSFRLSIKRTCYDSFYPFGILSRHHLTQLDFEAGDHPLRQQWLR